jgi:hypothetical protein
MKKYFLVSFLIFLFITPLLAGAAGLVPCGNPGEPACTLGHFFVLLAKVYKFLTLTIAAPLAVVMISVGAVMIIFSAGFPNLAAKGRQILTLAIIGLMLVLGSLAIIGWILGAVGYTGSWNIF